MAGRTAERDGAGARTHSGYAKLRGRVGGGATFGSAGTAYRRQSTIARHDTAGAIAAGSRTARHGVHATADAGGIPTARDTLPMSQRSSRDAAQQHAFRRRTGA